MSEAFDDVCSDFEANDENIEVDSDDNRACFDFDAFDDVLVDLEADENGSVDDLTEDSRNCEDDFRYGLNSDGFDDVFIDLEPSDDFEADEPNFAFSEDDFKAGFDFDVFEEIFADDEAGDDTSVEEMNFVDSEASCVPDSFEDADCDPLESFEPADSKYFISDDDFDAFEDVFINDDARDDNTLDKLTKCDKNSDENSKADKEDDSNKYDEKSDDDFKDSEISYDVPVDVKGRALDEYEVLGDGRDFEGSDGVCSDLKATQENPLSDSDVLDGVEADDKTLLFEEFA